MTVDDLVKEWLTEHAAVNLSERYATDAVGWWDREIATRTISRVRLARLADDPPSSRASTRSWFAPG